MLTSTVDANGATATYAFNPLGELSAVTYADNLTPYEQFTYDANGDTVDAKKGDVGDHTYRFDLDGNLASETEAGTKLTSPATYVYGTYPDGVHSSLSVSSQALTVSNLFRYVHRADGLQTKEMVKYSADGRSTQNFSWAYSAAGRFTNYADDEQKSSEQYDVNGLPSENPIPNNDLYYFFDPEGLLTGTTYINSPVGQGSAYFTYSLNDRGEGVGSSQSGTGSDGTSLDHPFAGMLFPDTKNTFDTPASVTFDPINSVKIADAINNSTEYATLASITSNWSYDFAGRAVSKTEQISNNPTLPTSNSIQYSYDATDHIIGTSCTLNAAVCPHGGVTYRRVSRIWCKFEPFSTVITL
ncbi:MAG: hypothetical protein GIW96_09900, partial [Candidatus Eremiobacteraeota bacterium]|nr:hypothetical protein [Candidatus Eremiobacteraeota bacterium]